MKAKPQGGRPKHPPVTPEEQALFLSAIGGTKPLDGRDRVPVPPPAPAPLRVPTLPQTVSLTVEGDGQRYGARAPGVSRAQLAELRNGNVHAEETLDLHGSTTAHAAGALRDFLLRANRHGRRCVLIVHGKGLHSEQGAPLRETVLGELLGELSGLVHALSTASPADGGEGATYIMLKGSR